MFRREKDEKMGQEKGSRTGGTLADKADRHALYQRAVQSPDVDVEFFERVFRANFHRAPTLLREDFCGTALVSCEWVNSKKTRHALGVDLDASTLAWGRKHNVEQLKQARRERIELREADVREVSDPKADVIAGQNFSYNIFKTREELRVYFEAAHANLADEGVLVLDQMGGAETQEDEREDIRKIGKGIKYVWEQRRFDPVTNEADLAIHFIFKDGSALNNAFEYDWRVWSLPELRELLLEAGFDRVDVYWEDEDEDGEGNGHYSKVESAPADPSWVACIVAVKGAASKK